MPDYRIGINALYGRFEIWNGYLPGKVRVIACGGTALTLLGCRALAEARHGGLDLERLAERFKETALGYPGEDRLLKNLEIFLEEQRGLSDGA